MLQAFDAPDGRLLFYGERGGPRCAVTLFRRGAVIPLRAGSYRACAQEGLQVQAGERVVEDGERPSVTVAGIRYYFSPLTGATIVGVVEAGSAIVLLGFIGGSFALAYYEPGWSTWLSAGVGSIDLDLWREMNPRPEAERASPRETAAPRDAELAALQRRVLAGHDEGEGEEPSVGTMVTTCLVALVDLAPIGRSRMLVAWLVDLIVRLGRQGYRGDLVGTKSRIAKVLESELEIRVSADDLADALGVLVELGCPFVRRAARTWTVALREVTDRSSSTYRALVEMVGGGFSLGRVGWFSPVQGGAPIEDQQAAETPLERSSAVPVGSGVGLDERHAGQGVVAAADEGRESHSALLWLTCLLWIVIEQKAEAVERANRALDEQAALNARERELLRSQLAEKDRRLAEQAMVIGEKERVVAEQSRAIELQARAEGTLEQRLAQLEASTARMIGELREQVGRFVTLAVRDSG